MGNHFVVFCVAAALWLVITTSANNDKSILDELASSSEVKELDEDRLNTWLNSGKTDEPVNQLDTESDDDSSDISKVLEPVSQPDPESDDDSSDISKVLEPVSQPDPESDDDSSDDISKVLEPVSQPGDLGMKKDEISETEEELDKLFYQFRMLHFRMKTINESTVYLEWTIMNATNGLDSNRLLNISKISKFKTELLTMNQRVAMRKEICHKHSDLLGKCNFTIPVNSCSNYQFRLGGERNTEIVTTVGVDPPTLREDLSEMGNSPIKLRWKITCDSDFMMPVFITLADMKTSSPKHETLNATCENRTCVTTTEKLRTSPCSKYSLKIEGGDLRIVNTPPTTKNLSAEAIPWKNQYLLRWSITPANCPFNPVLIVAKTNSLEKPVYNRLALKASPSEYCNKGFCEYAYEVEPCVTHWIKSSNSTTTPLKLLRPRVLELTSVYTGDLDNPVRLTWKVGCLVDHEIHFPIALTDGTTQQRNLSNVNATCDDDSKQCSAYFTKERDELLPCNRYEMEMEGSNEIITFDTPPPPTVSIRPSSSAYTINGTLVITVAFEGIQRSCGAWKNSIELEFLDVPSKAVLLPCTNNDDGMRKNCTVVLQVDPPDIVCYPVQNIRIRPVYSKSDVNVTMFRGSWLNTTITPMQPESWSKDERLANLAVKVNTSQQWMRAEWRNPVCLRGSATYPTNLTIVSSGTKEPLEYHLTIASQCSRSKSDPSKSSITVHNGEVTCSDGSKLPDSVIKLFNLTPCTNYSVIVKPLIVGHPEPISENSAIQTTFSTEFIRLQLGSLSPHNVSVSASHSTGNVWELKLGVQKKYCPCDDRIVSATFKIPSARLIEQVIPCTPSIDCHGKVKFNHLNLCRPLAVNVGLQYSKSYTSQIFWINKTLPPLVDANKNKNGTSMKPSLKVKEVDQHKLQLQWKNPVCLNGFVSSWNMDFHQENGSLFRSLNIPYNCSDANGSYELSRDHNVFLEAGQVVCETNRENYDIGLSPCTDYSVTVTPVVEGQSPVQLLEFSQSGNFTSLFNPSNVLDVKIVDVSSDNFEFSWTIPSRCLNSFVIDVEVNGTVLSIKPSENTLVSNIDVCDEIVCRMTKSINPSEMILAPCSDYTVRVGSTNLTFTTFPGDDELKISPDKTSVTAAITKNNLDIEMMFHTFDERCSARLVAIEFQLPDVFPPIQHVLLCELNTTQRERSSTICSTQIAINRMDKCEALPFNFRPLYEDVSYADKVSWVNMKLNPLLSQVQRSEKKITLPEIKVMDSDNQQTVLLNWNDPMCLMVDSLSWEVRINSTTDDIHRIRFPSECSLSEKGSTSFERSIRLENGHSKCNNSNNTFENEKDFTFSSCSSYLVSVIPVFGNLESITLEAYAQSTLLSIPLVVVNPNVTNVTTNTFSLEWSFPFECFDYVEMGEILTIVEFDGIETEINPSNLTLICDEMICTRLWTSPDNLTSCTEYTVSTSSVIQKVLTLPDPSQSPCDSYEETSVQKATAVRDSFTSITLIICLSMIGSILLGIIVGIGYGIRKRCDQSERDERYIQRFRDIYI